MNKRRCAGCRRLFRPRPQSPPQRFCSAAACQRERRRRWQRNRRRSDPDYRENQSRAQRRWHDGHPDYWREYRQRHPDYVAENRARQRDRDRRRRGRGGGEGRGEARLAKIDGRLAKSDASAPSFSLPAGTYDLIPVAVDAADEGLARMDACRVEIRSAAMA